MTRAEHKRNMKNIIYHSKKNLSDNLKLEI